MTKKKRTTEEPDVPSIAPAQLKELGSRLRTHDRTPLLPAGTVSECMVCGGPMRTTNDLTKAVPTPGGVYVLTRLPGARCDRCGAVEYDASALGAARDFVPHEIAADYETTVTVAGGRTLGTYFKQDLARVLALSGRETLSWKVLDRDRAIVEVHRGGRRRTKRSG